MSHAATRILDIRKQIISNMHSSGEYLNTPIRDILYCLNYELRLL